MEETIGTFALLFSYLDIIAIITDLVFTVARVKVPLNFPENFLALLAFVADSVCHLVFFIIVVIICIVLRAQSTVR